MPLQPPPTFTPPIPSVSSAPLILPQHSHISSLPNVPIHRPSSTVVPISTWELPWKHTRTCRCGIANFYDLLFCSLNISVDIKFPSSRIISSDSNNTQQTQEQQQQLPQDSLQSSLHQQEHQQMLEALAVSQATTPLPSSQPHTLPTRPHFDWLPSEELIQLLPELSEDLFSHQLSDDQKKSLIDNYPAIQGMRYTAPQAIPAAASRFIRSQSREDSTLRHLQYQLSAVFRPFDVLANELLQILPQDQLARFFIILRDIRTLLMHANSSINQARNHLALRTINPSFSAINNNTTYTMATDIFQTTVSQQASAQHALWDARPGFRRSLPNNSVTNQTNSSSATTPTNNSHFFRQGGTSGGAVWSQNNQSNNYNRSNNYTNQQQRRQRDHSSNNISSNFSSTNRQYPCLHSIIKHGFKIHFDQPPPLSSQLHLQPKLNHQQQQLLQQEIDQLIQKRALEPVYDPSPGFYSQMFIIPKKNGGHRPICNLKPLNQFLTAPAFKMETTYSRSAPNDQTFRLYDINRSYRCFSLFKNPQIISPVSSHFLEQSGVSIPHRHLWPLFGSLAFHKNYQANPLLGTSTKHPTQCIPQRLDYFGPNSKTSTATHSANNSETAPIRMDYQHQQVCNNTTTATSAPRVSDQHHNNDSSTFWRQGSFSSPVNRSNDQMLSYNTTQASQLNNENTISNFSNFPNSSLHSTSSPFHHPSSETSLSLGFGSTFTTFLQDGIAL
ncbi:hypothetical protein INT45_005347, partial [Circinella minor]